MLRAVPVERYHLDHHHPVHLRRIPRHPNLPLPPLRSLLRRAACENIDFAYARAISLPAQQVFEAAQPAMDSKKITAFCSATSVSFDESLAPVHVKGPYAPYSGRSGSLDCPKAPKSRK